jgi:tetratricopeptide (TPR) repeat protein
VRKLRDAAAMFDAGTDDAIAWGNRRTVNHKRIERIWRQKGLKVHPKQLMFRWRYALLIGMLLVVFVGLSYTAILTKSSTYDEPMHAVAGAVQRQQHDFRMDIDNPPLWLYWAELPNFGYLLKLDLSSSAWKTMTTNSGNEWQFAIDTLYHTPGTDGEAFVRRCRPMQLVLGATIGMILAIFTWQVGGSVAALIAVALFSLDPAFLAHAALLKNDVPIALIMLTLVWTLWHIGRRASIVTIVAAMLMSALTLTVKFSGIVLVPIAAALLMIRALMPFEWPIAGRILTNRRSRIVFVILLILMMGASAYVGAWASYGFRFRATSDREPIDTKRLLTVASFFRTEMDMPNANPQQIMDRAGKTIDEDWSTQVANIALQHRLFPEAWLNGLLFTKEFAKARPAYLCGQYSMTGWWYYFPLAVLFKTPLATLLVVATLVIGFFAQPIANTFQAMNFLKTSGGWVVPAIAVPFSVYALAALTGNLNIGVRHILPLFPFSFMAIAIGFSHVIARRRRLGITLGSVFFAMLVTETLIAWPNYLSFFNIACGGARGGFQLLADSNLDWGQDLPLLAKWQREHPGDKLYFSYPHTVDPSAYGIRFTALPENSPSAQPMEGPDGPPVVAISATVLQQVYFKTRTGMFDDLLRIEPAAVLGGTIYLWKGDSAVLNWLGTVLLQMNRPSEAIAALERAVQLEPANALSHGKLGTALAGVGQIPQALEHLRLAVKLDPNYENAHNNLGTLLAATGATQDAIAEFERAISLRPDGANAHVNLATLLLQTGQPAKAVEHYEAVLKLQPQIVTAYANLAKALATLNRVDEAIATAKGGIEVARSGGQEVEAQRIEEWLAHYRTEVQRGNTAEPRSDSPPASR